SDSRCLWNYDAVADTHATTARARVLHSRYSGRDHYTSLPCTFDNEAHEASQLVGSRTDKKGTNHPRREAHTSYPDGKKSRCYSGNSSYCRARYGILSRLYQQSAHSMTRKSDKLKAP